MALLNHEKERLPEKVHYITSPGYGPWRATGRLKLGGPSAVITTKGLLRFSPGGEAYLDSYHPGVAIEDILAHTGWPLAVSPRVHQTPAPKKKELRVIRSYDPKGFWTK